MRSRLEQLTDVARTSSNHRELVLNWICVKSVISSGFVESVNSLVKVVVRKSYGLRTVKIAKLALFYSLGRLPEPGSPHSFWEGCHY